MSNVESRVSDGMGRDGTSCCPFVQGQKENPSPVVPLSRDNGRSKNSGRIFSVPGRSNTKSITQWPKNLSKKNKKFFKKVKNCIFFLFYSFCPASWSRTGQDRQSKYQPGPWQYVKIPYRPVPRQDFELVPLSLCPGTMRELLYLCPAFRECPILLKTLVESV